MEKPPDVVTEGIEVVIARDLEKHKAILDRTKLEAQAFREGRSHEIRRKKHYAGLVGTGKYDDNALRVAMGQSAVNIQHMSDKVAMAEEQIKYHTHIVDTLAAQLKAQHKALDALAAYRRKNGLGH